MDKLALRPRALLFRSAQQGTSSAMQQKLLAAAAELWWIIK